jgi:hypothetical protein
VAQEYRIERMIDTVHFVEKGQAPLVALADVCAWAIKRYMAGSKGAEKFMGALLSKRPLDDAFGDEEERAAAHVSGWLVPAHCFDPAAPSANPAPALGFPSERKA